MLFTSRVFGTNLILLFFVVLVIFLCIACTNTSKDSKQGNPFVRPPFVPPKEDLNNNEESPSDSDNPYPVDNGDTPGEDSNPEPPNGSAGDDSQQIKDWISTLSGHLEIAISVSPDSAFANAHPNYREEQNMAAVAELWQFGWVKIDIDVPFQRINLLARRNYLRYIRYDETSNPLYIIPFWQRELVDDFPTISKDQINTLLDWIQRNGMDWRDPNSAYRVDPFATVPTEYPYANLLIRYYPSYIEEEVISEHVFAHSVDTYEDFMIDPLIRGSSILLNSFDRYFGDFANMPWESFIGYYDPDKL